MDVYQEYQRKLKTPEEAVRIVKSGDWVDYGHTLSFPEALDTALAARRNELEDVKIRSAISLRPVQVVEQDPEHKSFTFNVCSTSGMPPPGTGTILTKAVRSLFPRCSGTTALTISGASPP